MLRGEQTTSPNGQFANTNESDFLGNCSSDPYLVYLQSEEMWPAPPHLVQRVVLVMLRGSVFCQGRRILKRIFFKTVKLELKLPRYGLPPRPYVPVVVFPQRAVEPGQLSQLHLSQVILVLGRLDALLQNVPNLDTRLSEVSGSASVSNRKARSTRADLTCSTAFLTFSIVLAVTKACRGSSSPGSICPSFRPTFPSFTEPLPRIMILAQHSFSMFFNVFPLAKIKKKGRVRTPRSFAKAFRDMQTRLIESKLPWPDEQADEVDFGVFVLGDHNFVVDSGGWRSSENKRGVSFFTI